MYNSLRFRAFVAVWFYTAETLITDAEIKYERNNHGGI